MARMHRALTTDFYDYYAKVTRHYAYGYSSTPHEISTNETWDFIFKSYNDIVIRVHLKPNMVDKY
jgi:hypothetical protein